jgi:hypothetical protein
VALVAAVPMRRVAPLALLALLVLLVVVTVVVGYDTRESPRPTTCRRACRRASGRRAAGPVVRRVSRTVRPAPLARSGTGCT